MMNQKKTTRIVILIISGVLVLLAVIALVFTGVIIPRQKYEKALALLYNGEYDAAYLILEELGRRDVVAADLNKRADDLLEEGESNAAYALLSGVEDETCRKKRMEIKQQQITETPVGKYFTLGSYEQDNKTANGPEPIEWVILDREEDRILVISRYVLDCLHYDEEYKPVTWETCTLRAWLNGEFLNTAFDLDEMSLIQITHVAADPNPEFSVDPGNDTEDRIFLLSIPEAERYFHPVSIPAPHGSSVQEAERYFHTYSTLWCKPTAFAAPKSNVDFDFSQNEAVGWWFRTPGLSSASAAMADRLGMIDTWGKLVNCEGGIRTPGVRPAMWIDLGSSCEEVIP